MKIEKHIKVLAKTLRSDMKEYRMCQDSPGDFAINLMDSCDELIEEIQKLRSQLNYDLGWDDEHKWFLCPPDAEKHELWRGVGDKGQE
jgi:hypothetical protein